ncbi:MAG: PAS domain-containing protein [Mailhella sp.]|nr:PAS domain-containing protein [Mailhella sp.]
MKSRTFTVKIFLSFCLVILCSVFVPATYFLHTLRQESIELAKEAAVREVSIFQNILTTTLKGCEPNEKHIAPLFRGLTDSGSHRITVITSNGSVLYDSHLSTPGQIPNHLSQPEIVDALEKGSGLIVRMSSTLHETFVYAARKVETQGQPFVVRVSAPLSLVNSYANARIQALLIGGVAAFLMSCGFAAFFSIRFRRSLRLMISSVENLATPGIRSGRISMRKLPGDEFAPLAGAVNTMAQRMEDQVNHILAQKAQLDAVLNSIAEGVLVVDHEGRVRSVNAALIHLFPRTVHAEGLMPSDVIPSEDLQKGIEALKYEMPEKPITFEMDTESGRKLQVLICPIIGEIKMLMAVAVFHDITDMSVLMDMRRDFVANVSHELRTPLTAIMGYAESLKRFVTEPRGQHFLSVIDRNSQYMATMVKDLLQLSSIESGAIPMNIKVIPASGVLRSGMDLCRTAAEIRGLEFKEELEGGDFFVKGDSEYLSRVMRNLLENACRYAPEDSVITLSAEVQRESGVALFRVKDMGPGIPQELRSRVFERFFRVEKHRGGQISTGLGLAICKHIIERHGGRVYVEDGEGCVMCFTVPLA